MALINILWHYFKKRFFLLALLFLSLFINIGSLFYYFYRFNSLVLIITFILSLFLTLLFLYFSIYRTNQQASFSILLKPYSRKASDDNFIAIIRRIFLPLITLILFFTLFFLLNYSASFSAIASPWHFLSASFLVVLISLLLLIFLNIFWQGRWSYLFLFLLYFLFFSVSLFIYKIAFGYDQLLHQRALQEILQRGLIQPKTIYYLGQYFLELTLFKICPYSIALIDRLLVPVLASILIPSVFIYNFNHRGFYKTIWPLVFFLVLPFSFFTYTVPQNLAFLFFLIFIFFCFNRKFVNQEFNFLFLFSWALSIFFIHPLAGVPALIFLFILFLRQAPTFTTKVFVFNDFLKYKPEKVRIFRSLAYFFQIITLPILLLFFGGRLSFWKINFSNLLPRLLNQENVVLNFIYFFFENKILIFLILLILITIFIFKYQRQDLKAFYFNSLALLLSYGLSLFIDFPFLSQIDKNSYAQRILILALIFLLPALYEMFLCFLRALKDKKAFFKAVLIIFFLALLLSSFYLNYPRQDKYFNSRSFSVSEADFKAVHFIEEHKEHDNYIVLANQQLGAAAIREFGFKRYYGPWFYYSVQTGGPFYDYYLKMIEDPNRDLMTDLMRETGAKAVYLAINDYWWAFDRIVEELQDKADEVHSLDNKIMIFYFRR